MNRLIISLIFAAFFIVGNKQEAKAQCKQQLVYQCATNNDRAIYLRDFNAKLRKGRQGAPPSAARFSVVLNKGTHYRFNLCNPKGFEGKTIMTLYDNKHPDDGKSHHASTFDVASETDYSSFDFVCNKSGVYYVSIKFKDGEDKKKSCAVGILSFVGKNK